MAGWWVVGLLGCTPEKSALEELRPSHIRVRLNGGEDHETLAVEVDLDPVDDGCETPVKLRATLDGVDLGEPWTGGHPRASCQSQRWTTPSASLPRGRGDKRLEITDGQATLVLTIPDPAGRRRLVPAAPLGGTVDRGQPYTWTVAADGVVTASGFSAWSPAGSVAGDGNRVQQPATTSPDARGVVVTVPAALEPGGWRLFVWAVVQIPVDCPVASCDVSTFARFSQPVTVQ